MENESISKSNLFARISANAHDKKIKAELVLWIGTCVAVAFSLLALVLMASGSSWGGAIAFWFMLLLLGLGYGTFLALRWKKISILYGNVLFTFIMLIAFYNLSRNFFWGYLRSNALYILVFTIALLTELAVIICVIIDFSTALNLRLPVMICCWIAFGFTIIMLLLPYFLAIEDLGYLLEYRYYFVIGSLAFFLICCVVWGYTIAYYMGVIDQKEGVPFHKGFANTVKTNMVAQQAPVGIQCIQGSYQGQAFPVQGEIIIGSQQGSAHIIIQDAYVSKQHCSIRYNAVSGNYEVRDMSTNGVFLQNGVRLQNGVYLACPRGTVLLIGSQNQQFRLM